MRPAATCLALPLLLFGCGSGSSPATSDDVTPRDRAGDASSPDDAVPAPWFVRAPDDGGLDFWLDVGHRERYFMPESVSGGIGLLDMDNDGDLDAYLVQAGHLLDEPERRPTNRLFENLGGARFQDVTEVSGTAHRGYGMGAICGDYDNDGDADIFLTNFGTDVLFRNRGDGTFEDVSEAAGITREGWSTSGTFFDYDEDGDLDLYVCNYLFWSAENEIDCYNEMGALDYCAPSNYGTPAPDILYRNNGDGTFTDVSEAAGITRSFGPGLGVVAGDFDLDGRLDLFVANDGMKDQLWINQGDGTFVNDALLAGCAVDQDGVEKAGMGVTTADLDDDGDLDLLVCNLFQESDSMYRNDGGFFTDVTAVAGLGHVSRTFTRFGMAWHDFNHDGLADLYQANGGVKRNQSTYSDDPYAEPNLLFRGVGPMRFVEQKPRGGTAEPLYGTSRAAAFGDLDNDGDVDIIVANVGAEPYLLINEAPKQGHWLLVRVLNQHGSDALHATVTLTLEGRTIARDVRPHYSYLASNDPRVHFGLGKAGRVADLIVTWLDGTRESFGAMDADRIVTVRRGGGSPAPAHN